MQKVISKPRHEIRRAQDNGPTPERAGKSLFTRGNPPRVLTTVQALLNAGDISQDAANAGERWYRDYVFGKNGYVEFAPDHISDQTTKHDDVSWQVVRANSWGLVIDVRLALGLCAHRRLEMMLVEEKSFAQMGRELFPNVVESSARRKIGTQCALVLEQLSEFYQTLRRKKENTCTPRADLVTT